MRGRSGTVVISAIDRTLLFCPLGNGDGIAPLGPAWSAGVVRVVLANEFEAERTGDGRSTYAETALAVDAVGAGAVSGPRRPAGTPGSKAAFDLGGRAEREGSGLSQAATENLELLVTVASSDLSRPTLPPDPRRLVEVTHSHPPPQMGEELWSSGGTLHSVGVVFPNTEHILAPQ